MLIVLWTPGFVCCRRIERTVWRCYMRSCFLDIAGYCMLVWVRWSLCFQCICRCESWSMLFMQRISGKLRECLQWTNLFNRMPTRKSMDAWKRLRQKVSLCGSICLDGGDTEIHLYLLVYACAVAARQWHFFYLSCLFEWQMVLRNCFRSQEGTERVSWGWGQSCARKTGWLVGWRKAQLSIDIFAGLLGEKEKKQLTEVRLLNEWYVTL